MNLLVGVFESGFCESSLCGVVAIGFGEGEGALL